MMCSYIPKPNKNVLMLSTLTNQPEISQRFDRKPEIILDYNAKKGGVDTVDQMIDTYRVKAATRRWPKIVFYTIKNLSIISETLGVFPFTGTDDVIMATL